MKSLFLKTMLKYAGILNEDTALAYTKSLYKNCFENGITVSKTRKDFNSERLKINDKFLNYPSADSFSNEVISIFKKLYPQVFSSKQLQSFEGVIKDLATDYYNQRKAQ